MHNLMYTFVKPCCVKIFYQFKQYRKQNGVNEHIFYNDALYRTEVITQAKETRQHLETPGKSAGATENSGINTTCGEDNAIAGK